MYGAKSMMYQYITQGTRITSCPAFASLDPQLDILQHPSRPRRNGTSQKSYPNLVNRFTKHINGCKGAFTYWRSARLSSGLVVAHPAVVLPESGDITQHAHHGVRRAASRQVRSCDAPWVRWRHQIEHLRGRKHGPPW